MGSYNQRIDTLIIHYYKFAVFSLTPVKVRTLPVLGRRSSIYTRLHPPPHLTPKCIDMSPCRLVSGSQELVVEETWRGNDLVYGELYAKPTSQAQQGWFVIESIGHILTQRS